MHLRAILLILFYVATLAFHRELVKPASITRLDNVEIAGTTDATGNVIARAGVQLTAPTTGPTIKSGTGGPNGAVTATLGSLFVRTDTAQVFQNTDGAQAWQVLFQANSFPPTTCAAGLALTAISSTAAGTCSPPTGVWTLIVDDTLQGGSLTGWTQRAGTWTADANGFHVDSGTAESYLSYESGGTEAAPFPMFGVAMQVELAFNSSSSAANDGGFVTMGPAGAVSAGTWRVFNRKDGTVMGADISSATMGFTLNPALGAIGNNNFHTFKIQQVGRQVTYSWDGVTYGTSTMGGNANNNSSQASVRVGLWCNPGRCDFRNLKIWRMISSI